MRKRPFLTGIVFLIIILFGGLVFLWYESRGVKGLAFSVQAPPGVLIGVPFGIDVVIANNSSNVLNDAKLALFLPDDVVFSGNDTGKRLANSALGNLGIQSSRTEHFDLIALAGVSTVKQIRATIDYLPNSLGGRFEQTSNADVSISGDSVFLDATAPKKVFNGQDFEVEISYKNLSGADISNMDLLVRYPTAFKFISSSLKNESGNALWRIVNFPAGAEGKFTVKGVLTGPENAFYDFGITAQRDFAGRSYKVNNKTVPIAISASPLSLSINVNGDPNYIVRIGDDLVYTIRYRNGTDLGLRDTIIRAQLIGDMFDFGTLVTDAAIRSADNTLAWTAANASGLGLIEPGASGLVTFRIKAKSSYPIKRFGDKNFILKVTGEIESPTVPQFVGASKTSTLVKLESKVAGNIAFRSKGFFRDAPANVINKGPFPPVAGKNTQFTVHWVLTNFSTDMRDVSIKAFLGNNVRATGLIKSNAPTIPKYNERTQEMTWLVPRVAATKGVIDDPYEAIFQVEFLPSANQAGLYAVLAQRARGVAVDDFTGQDVELGDVETTTRLPDDPTVTQEQGVILAQ